MAQHFSNAHGIGLGDINSSPQREDHYEFFPIGIREQEKALRDHMDLPSEKNQIIRSNEEKALCHHAFQEGVSATEIHEYFAVQSVNRCRAALAAVNQIVYHLCRQSVSGRVNAATLSGFFRGGLLQLKDSVAYSCHWAAQQMEKWWGDGMSPSTFRRIRDDFEALGCFEVERVKFQATRKITNLHHVDIRQLLRVAAVLIERLSAELDGFVLLMPSHRVGFLAALWGHYFTGTIYAPDTETQERSIESTEAELARAEELAQSHGWSDYLAFVYRLKTNALKRTIRHLRDRCRAECLDHRLFEEPLPF